jgi:hypothetical protein
MSVLVAVYHSLWTTYESQLKGQGTLEDGTNRLSLNIGKPPPIYAEKQPQKAKISCTAQQKPEISLTSRVYQGPSQAIF